MNKNKVFECKFCKSEIKKGATICPVCKKDLRNSFSKHPIITFLLIIFIIGMIWSNLDNNSSNINNNPTSWSCSGEMKETVANEYKSPSTVKFITCDWDKSKWIFWEADSENWFWWTVRSNFLCNWDTCLITEK